MPGNRFAMAMLLFGMVTSALAPATPLAAETADEAGGGVVRHQVWLRLHVDAEGGGRLDNGPLAIPLPLFERLNRFVTSLRFEPARRGGEPVDGTMGLVFKLELRNVGNERLVVWIERVMVAPLPLKSYLPRFPRYAIIDKRSGRVEGTYTVKANGRTGTFRALSTPATARDFLDATRDAVGSSMFEAPTVGGKPVDVQVAFCHQYHWDPNTEYSGPPCSDESYAAVDDGLMLADLASRIERQALP